MERRSSTACMKCGVFYIPSPNQLCRLQCASCEKPPLGHYDIKCKRCQQIFCDNLYKTVKCPYCSPAPRGGHRRNETSHKRYNPYLNRRREQSDVIEPIPHSSHTELRSAHLTRGHPPPLHQAQPPLQMGGYETVSPPVNTMLRIHTHSPAQPLHQDINDTPLCIDLASSDSCSSSSGSESDTAGRTVATSGSHREGRRTRSRPHSTPISSPSPIPQSISDSYDSNSSSSSSSSGENRTIFISDSDSDDSSADRDLDPPASVNSDLLAPSGVVAEPAVSPIHLGGGGLSPPPTPPSPIPSPPPPLSPSPPPALEIQPQLLDRINNYNGSYVRLSFSIPEHVNTSPGLYLRTYRDFFINEIRALFSPRHPFLLIYPDITLIIDCLTIVLGRFDGLNEGLSTTVC
ncbi:rho GTPase-activating protein gacII-like [Procambarus clarkii]|uniref:rho GTPase-activating protein gacII-like n=1 Tax=Procambarus clarkii TaxID=6728 RepID=UPI0037423A0E